jgi:hypothetical protein
MKKTNTKLQPSTKKRSNFDQVAGGVCPHDGAKLADEVAGKGVGVTRVCTKCRHTWYLNRKIKTCKCQTCSASKRSTGKPEISESVKSASISSDASVLSGLRSNQLS